MFEFIFLLNWFTFIGFLLSDFIINYGTYGYDHNKKNRVVITKKWIIAFNEIYTKKFVSKDLSMNVLYS